MSDPTRTWLSMLDTWPGQTRQVSSSGRDERGGTWFGLRPAAAKPKRILLEPDESHQILNVEGPGTITRIFMTTFLPLRRHALRDLVVRMYWDHETEPSVECGMGDFFGTPFGKYTAYDAAPLNLTSGGFNCAFPMPFATGARLELANEGRLTIDPIFFNVTYYEHDAPPLTPLRFHAQWRREELTQPNVPYTILKAQGDGRYIGCRLDMQNRQWWLKLPIGAAVFPYGFGFGMLEGPEQIRVDGESEPSVSGTGTEDYFNAGWYYYLGKFSTPTHGCLVRDLINGRVSAYRFDVSAPVAFKQSIEVTMNHGFVNEVATDYASVAYWYQTEPHLRMPPLPEPNARRPRLPIANAVQTLSILGPVAMAGSAVARSIRRRAKQQ